ncbi:AraC family transcriptional regulator [Bradyrhizobium sp. STM 3809]|uniref:AraC family transcriptional regulator n=1 Tax=Bradyrhizobium sp. STM 3809 TaxID=551936 RepID=UPI0002409845|nr:AraC family transcriptional regulator [Bradyrhizobium sp. STM 3809]CCE01634.1 putative Transcriptional regulatory protein, AraC/XylS family with a AraC_E_bind domain [Bradyrhizobium sp. STM 3809]
MKAALRNHHARMQRVLDHIDRHLDEDLDLSALSSVAAYSKYHFHRQFTATFGLSVHRYVQLARMKRASYQLAYGETPSVTDVAMEAGYDAPDAFARAFRQRIGQSPSAFRKSPDWEPWLAAFGPLDDARSKFMQTTFTPSDVTIRDVPPTRVAIIEHRGDPAMLGVTVQRFIAWRKAAGLHPRTHPTFTVWRSERRPDSPADYSVDLCVGTDRPCQADGDQVKFGEIPGGRCAVLRVVGNTHNLEPAALYLYRDWLPASGEEARDFPIYCQRLSFFPDVPEHEAAADVFLPLK